jgi:hypothetical protein
MFYFFFVLVSGMLFVGFLVLTKNEASRGARYFARERGTLDQEVERWTVLVSHIDIATFVRTGLRSLLARVIHDVAHASLIAVRFLEKLLTRAVQALRMRRAKSVITSTAPSSDFVATMKDFKQELRNGRKTEEPPAALATETTNDSIAE